MASSNQNESNLAKKGKKLVVVGGVATGAVVAAKFRRLCEQSEIILIERSPNVSVGVCGFPYYLGGMTEKQNLLLLKTSTIQDWYNLDIRLQSDVVRINREAKTVTVRDLKNNREYDESYDFLTIATGARPFLPPIPGIDLPDVYALRTLENVEKIECCVNKNPNHCTIIGAGSIGLELADNLRKRIKSLTLLDLAPQVCPNFDPEMVKPLDDEIRKTGIDLRLSVSVTKIVQGTETALELLLSTGDVLKTDMAIFAIGTVPESSLAKDCGLKLGPKGHICVDSHMVTSDPSIYAVGAVVEIEDLVSHQKFGNGLAGVGHREGRIAALHMSGRTECEFRGSPGTGVVMCFGMTAAMTGASERSLKKMGIKYSKTYIHRPNHPKFYPESSPIHLKIMFDCETGLILGGQGLGKEGVEKRIDILSFAIQTKCTVFQLEDLETSYAPPFNSPKDPDNYLGSVSIHVMRGDLKQKFSEDLQAIKDLHLVDVREPSEYERGYIVVNGTPAVNIPLPKMRASLDKIPKDKTVVVYCGVGMRSYLCYQILKNNGFTNVYNLAGGITTAGHCGIYPSNKN